MPPRTSFDASLAKQQLETLIAEKETELTELKQQRSILDKADDDVLKLFDLLYRYGRASRASGDGGSTEPTSAFRPEPGRSLTENIVGIINAASRPLRFDDILQLLAAAGISVTKQRAYNVVSGAKTKKQIRAMGHGLYGPIHASTNGHAKATAALAHVTAADTDDPQEIIRAVLHDAPDHKLAPADLLDAVKQTSYYKRIKGLRNPMGAIRKVTAKMKDVRISGHSRGTRYELRG